MKKWGLTRGEEFMILMKCLQTAALFQYGSHYCSIFCGHAIQLLPGCLRFAKTDKPLMDFSHQDEILCFIHVPILHHVITDNV